MKMYPLLVTLPLLLFITSILTGCTDKNETVKQLQEQGFSNVQVLGYTPRGCPLSSTHATMFSAVGPNGKQITGVACSGLTSPTKFRFLEVR